MLPKYILKLLKTKKGNRLLSARQVWAVKVALDTKSLHENGSYLNALSLQLDLITAGALNDLLNVIDKYHNLQLILAKEAWIQSLWLKIFEQIEISGVIVQSDSDTNEALFATFKCKFPYFWLLFNSIESHWSISAVKGILLNFILHSSQLHIDLITLFVVFVYVTSGYKGKL